LDLVFEKNKKITMIVGTILIFALIYGVFSHVATSTDTISLDEAKQISRSRGSGVSGGMTQLSESLTFSGQTNEGGSTENAVEISSDQIMMVKATLSWNDDETAGGPMSENDPDTFSVTITSPTGETVTGSSSDSGTASVEFKVNETASGAELTGPWAVIVNCEDAGDIHTGGPLGALSWPDTGNAWTLSVSYVYMGTAETAEE